MQWDVSITATKVFDMFIDTNKNFTIAKKKHEIIVTNAITLKNLDQTTSFRF